MDEVEHAFFLRRAVPWTRAGPVLVIEAGRHFEEKEILRDYRNALWELTREA